MAPRRSRLRAPLGRRIDRASHHRGVIHRDLKSSNIIVTDRASTEFTATSATPLPDVKATLATEIGVTGLRIRNPRLA